MAEELKPCIVNLFGVCLNDLTVPDVLLAMEFTRAIAVNLDTRKGASARIRSGAVDDRASYDR